VNQPSSYCCSKPAKRRVAQGFLQVTPFHAVQDRVDTLGRPSESVRPSFRRVVDHFLARDESLMCPKPVLHCRRRNAAACIRIFMIVPSQTVWPKTRGIITRRRNRRSKIVSATNFAML